MAELDGRTFRIAALAAALMAFAIGAGGVVLTTVTKHQSDAATNTLHWVALGDSYSAGNGGAGPESAFCHRDWETSYPKQARTFLSNTFNVAADWKIDLEACSGAVTWDLWRPQPGKTNGGTPRPQLDAVDGNTDVVTMTMGGNDAGFAATLTDCHFWGGLSQTVFDSTSDWFPGCWGRGLNDIDWMGIQNTLRDGYAQIRREMNQEGHLFLLTYPYLFATGDNFDGTLGTCEGVSSGAVQMVAEGQDKVAETIQAASVAATMQLTSEGIVPNIHVVDIRSVDNWKSATNGLCSKTVPRSEWFINGANLLGDGLDSFHPTPRGYEHMGYWLAEEMAKVYRTNNVPDPSPTGAPSPVVGVLGLDLTEMPSDGIARQGRWGFGASPGEAVELAIFDDAGTQIPTTSGAASTAGADGRFWISWVCDPPDAGRSWRLTMRGRSSGRNGEQWIACVRPTGAEPATVPAPQPVITEPPTTAAPPTAAPIPAPTAPQPQPRDAYNTTFAPSAGYGTCGNNPNDRRGSTPSGTFLQTFTVPSGVVRLDWISLPRSMWLDFDASIVRGGQELTRVIIPKGTDWETFVADFPDITVTPGETLTIRLDSARNSNGVGFWQAVTSSDAATGALHVTNPCAWAQGAHPAEEDPVGDLVAAVGGWTG